MGNQNVHNWGDDIINSQLKSMKAKLEANPEDRAMLAYCHRLECERAKRDGTEAPANPLKGLKKEEVVEDVPQEEEEENETLVKKVMRKTKLVKGRK